ncbi:hypothetical protein [Candidatus Formimonas warabiya]|uniref:Uncharacterized protein n=1 Tax=Formimonas warabiya TaxID=1761012 RepID=A0A3G1KNX8_FORW1|nr:hypothetical protein [Candidatus Formimonas warabiya]ATW24169.1 hypothetical protein DCMF_04665 [Candidatus Formimonas warabiya]
MAELTNEMIQKRFETVSSGTYSPEIPGLPGITFIKLGLKERGQSSRAYSARLKELMAAGGYFSEALLPTVLEKACRENGMDLSVIGKQRAIQKRFYDSIPPELMDPYDKLTEEEVALLPEEVKAERQEAIEERGRQIMEFMQNFYSVADKKVFEQCRQIEALEQHLKANTAEHHARKHQMETEILLCARRSDDINIPYFSSIEDIQELEDRNRTGLVQLYLKWKQFREGLTPEFFRPNSAALQ